MIDMVTDGIPKKRRELPFINQMRTFPVQRHCDIDLQNIEIADVVADFVKIHATLGYLFGSGCLSAPFDTFNQYSARTLKFERQNVVRYSFPIIFHSG